MAKRLHELESDWRLHFEAMRLSYLYFDFAMPLRFFSIFINIDNKVSNINEKNITPAAI